jgi:ribosomal protein S18 acetylase RimI-like enzyme
MGVLGGTPMPRVRTATVADTDAILELWDENVTGRTLPDAAKDIHRLLRHAPETLLVAELKGRVIGAIIAGWDGWRGNIYRLAVDASLRRQGIAIALVEEAERRLASWGCQRVTALIVTDEDAPKFWKAIGYEHDSKARRYVRNIE